MFDIVGFADLDALATADDAAVVAAISGWAAVEAAAAARRLAAIAELVKRRWVGPDGCDRWVLDSWEAAAAEVSAALNVTRGAASGQMYLANALRNRLPKVAAVFAAGKISARLVSMIAWHTTLITDLDAMGRVDAALAARVTKWERLSVHKTAEKIEAIVDSYDPGALRRTREQARSRDVVIDKKAENSCGITAFWGRLYTTDATVLDRRLDQLAREVCDADPRTVAQRRADALGVLAAGGEHLVCGCGQPDCPAGDRPRASGVVIHVVADAVSVAAPADPELSGEDDPADSEAPDTEPETEPETEAGRPSLLMGSGVLPHPLLGELIRNGATLRPVRHPGDSPAESGYHPSRALADFVRCRDLTCRFPGCERPAEFCDIDHTVAWPAGPTHASNLKTLCRAHHLLKTFWPGWRDQQRPDGTVVWTAPSGHTYTTRPGSSLLFPTLCLPTGDLPTPPPGRPPSPGRTLKMPTRARTRAQDREYRIKAERALNAAHVAERNQPPPF